MKYLALLLSLFVLTLSAVPCCAFESGIKIGQECTRSQQTPDQSDVSSAEHTDHGGQGKDCCTQCPPFYTCGSCTGFTLSTADQLAFMLPFQTVQHNTAYHIAQLPLIQLYIWQPPQR